MSGNEYLPAPWDADLIDATSIEMARATERSQSTGTSPPSAIGTGTAIAQ